MQHSHDKASSHECPACDYGRFTRNNYFTGKLLVERDFTDEQRYYVDKLRHHQQRLHGWGVVCGLKVKPHDNDDCRDRFVCIEPGSAVDCCGHDIIVREAQCLDFRQFPEIKKLEQDEDTKPHTLQICVRYRECPTEEIPVLYDECGCDDTQCAPNRILESHEFSIILDGEADHSLVHGPKLSWTNTIAVQRPMHVAFHEATHRLYVADTQFPSTITQFNTDDHTKVTSRTLPTGVVGLAVSKDGGHLFVAAAAAGAGQNTKFHVLETSLNLPAVSETDRPNNWESGVEFEVAADGRLYGRVIGTTELVRFDLDVTTSPAPGAATVVMNLGGLRDLVLSSDGKQAFSVGGDQLQRVADIDGTATKTLLPFDPPLPPDTDVTSIVVLGNDLLAMSDQRHRKVYLIEVGATTAIVKGSATLTYSPLQMVASADGDWLYVEERYLDKLEEPRFVQAVSVHALQHNPLALPGKPLRVGWSSQGIFINHSMNRLYVPVFNVLGTDPRASGVVVIDIIQEPCDEILWRDLDGCAHCEQPNCIVLATIQDYHFGDKILELVDPRDSSADSINHIARINNRLGRRLLPSTQVLTEVVQCLLDRPAGEKGETGEPGTDGAGGITDVRLTMVRCNVEESAEIFPEGDKIVLELIIPTICDRDLAKISGINWQHGKEFSFSDPQITENGLLIAFSHPVMPEDITEQSVQVLKQRVDQEGNSCWCEVPGTINPIKFDEVGEVDTPFTTFPPAPDANGIQFLPRTQDSRFTVGRYRVVVKGDFIRDAASKKAVDADHMPPWFGSTPGGGGPYKTGNAVAGGTFESWFTLG